MNVIERNAARASDTAAAADVPAPPLRAQPSPARKLRPLLSLIPYLERYRGRMIAGLVALLIAAATTLVVPIAARRMIDFGFSQDTANLIDSYFTVMIGLVGVLAVASAGRFFLITTLGERMLPICASRFSAI